MYNRQAISGTQTGSATAVLDLAAGDKLRLRFKRVTGTSGISCAGEATGITLLSLLA